jgi:hypothetical protein
MMNPFDPQNNYFPDFDDDAISPFALPFCRLMFAYANLDREIARLVSASTGDPSHEDKFRRGSVGDLAEEVETFIRKHGGDVTEIAAIKELLGRSHNSYEIRNLLAHGHWWVFDPRNGKVEIRRDRNKPDQERFVEITVDQIEEAISDFKDVEMELFKVRRRIESRRLSNQQDIK